MSNPQRDLAVALRSATTTPVAATVGRPPTRAAQTSWITRRLAKHAPGRCEAHTPQLVEGLEGPQWVTPPAATGQPCKACAAVQRGNASFIRRAAAGITPADVRAWTAMLMLELRDDRQAGTIDPRHYAGTSAKLMDVLVKLLQLDRIDAAETPGRVEITVNNINLPAGLGAHGDVIEVG